MKAYGYDRGLGDSGNWVVWTVGGIDYDWLDDNLPWWRLTAADNIVVESEEDAVLIYLRFK